MERDRSYLQASEEVLLKENGFLIKTVKTTTTKNCRDINDNNTKLLSKRQNMTTKWRYSEAKKLLRKDIVDGVVTMHSNVHVVYNMRDGIYLDYEFEKFRNNLKNLIVAVQKDQTDAATNTIALNNTLDRKPPPDPANQAAYPPWHSSPARMYLLQDLANGVFQGMKPSQIQQTRQEYQEFPSRVFRDNYYKEVHKPVTKAYWQFQKELSEQKKQRRKE
jgi:hypothetical protein